MDAGHDYTDERIEAIAEQVRSIYAEASASAEKSLSEWLERFAEKDEEWRAAVESGDATKDDWQRWRRMQMIQGRRWRAIAEQMAEGFTGANEQAAQIISGELPAIAAENANWGTFSVEKAAGVSTSFALQDAGTIHALLSEAAGLSVATVAVNEAADIAWNRKGIQSQITQGIMLGESIPKIAKRMERVGATNKAQAIRWARTFTAAAEGAGRIASYKRAIAMGIKLKHQWEATLDDRTRHSHRQVDGEVREVGERFSNGCRYTGDPSAPYSEICNCRCALRPVLEGVDQSDSERWSKLPEGMTYEQWKDAKAPKKDEKAAERVAESLRAALVGGEAVNAKVVRSLVGKMVQLGPEAGKAAADYIDLAGVSPRGSKLFDEAVSYVPTAMLETVKRGKVSAVRDMSLNRSEFDPDSNTMVMARGADALTVVHELMHAVEEHDPEFLEAERDYFELRTKGKKKRPISELTGNDEYEDGEFAFDVGECVDPYAFKDYHGDGYELMSVGVETLYRSPSAYLRDSGMLKWVMKMLRGV